MNFEFSDEQKAIRELAAQIFADASNDESLLAMARRGEIYNEELWQTLSEQGLLAICLPEEYGGIDLGLTEMCLLLEEQGRHVAPVPLFANLVLGALPILQYGSAEQHQRWLAPYAAGQLKLTAAIAELGMHEAIYSAVQALEEADGWTLSGTVSMVPDGAIADLVLVPVTHEDGGRSVVAVSTTAEGVNISGQEVGLLGEKAAQIRFGDVHVAQDSLIGQRGQGEDILVWLEERANLGHCAQQVGVSEEAMKRTATYISEREQFGVPLGSFQALAMRMADSFIDIEAMRSTYWLALWRLDSGIESAAEIRTAKWWACDGAHRVVQTAQHLHGGMGADVEYPIHRFFLWAKQISYSLGNASLQLEKLGALLAADDSQGFKGLEV